MSRPTRQPFRGRLTRLGVNERRSTPSRCAGVVATACTQGKRAQHGRPQGVVSDGQPDAREGQAGRFGETERFAVPRKPGNAGGGKGPQFKTNARRGEGPGDWATYQLRRVFGNCRRRCTRKRRQKPAIASTPATTRSAATTSWPMPMPSAAPTRALRGWTSGKIGALQFGTFATISAITGPEQVQQNAPRKAQSICSITSSAVASRVGGTASPSILAV